jgi:hypothetical protein
MPLLQFARYIFDEQLIAGNRQAVLGIEVFKVCEQFGEFVAQPRIGKNLPVTVPFVPLYEGSDQCIFVVHQVSVAQFTSNP